MANLPSAKREKKEGQHRRGKETRKREKRRTSSLLRLLLCRLSVLLLLVEVSLEGVDLVGTLLRVGVLNALEDVGDLLVGLLESGADSNLDRLGDGGLDEAGSEGTEEVDQGRVLRLANGELELVNLDLGLDDLRERENVSVDEREGRKEDRHTLKAWFLRPVDSTWILPERPLPPRKTSA
jgi:hypothetical protein